MRTRARIRSVGQVPAVAVKVPAIAVTAPPVPGKFSADLPWRGPMLGDSGEDKTLLIAVACDPSIGSAFGVACVPLLDSEEKSPRLPGKAKRGVGLGDGKEKVKEALRDCVIWIPQGIDSATPLQAVQIPLKGLDKNCSRMLPVLLSHLAPADDGISTEPVPSDGTFPELYDAVTKPEHGLGIPLGDVGDSDEFKEELVDCIFDLIDPVQGAWTRFESAVLHRPSVRNGASPKHTDEEISFFLASCLYPAGLFDGTPRYGNWPPGPADASLCRLARMIDAQPRQQRRAILIMSGDQIYADASAGLFDARLIDDRLHFGYERLYRGRGATEAFARILPVMLMDDHEIRDNWEPEAPLPTRRKPPIDPNVIYQESGNWEQRNQGVKEYWGQQRCHWRPVTDCPLKAPIDSAFSHDRAHFRLMDTRTRRERRTAATIGKAKIVTVDQMRQLQDWLTDTAKSGKPRFIDTPSAFLPRHRAAIPALYDARRLPLSWASALRSDAWDGYPRSQHELLACLVTRRHENVVFLSGDEHVPFVTWAKITDSSNGTSVVIRSIHSSPLYAPYPFSNADLDDLAGDDTFDFELDGVRFHCEVKTRFFTCGAGYAKVNVKPSSSGSWEYQVEFFGEAGPQTYRSSGDAPWNPANPAPPSPVTPGKQ